MKVFKFALAAAVAGIAALAHAQAQPAGAPALRSQVVETGVFIIPGDRLLVDLRDLSKPQIIETRKQEAIENPSTLAPGSITIHMTAAPAPTRGTILSVRSGLTTPLRYHALLMVPRADGKLEGHPTTICPVKAGLAGIELWSEKPVAIMITRFETTMADDTGCKI